MGEEGSRAATEGRGLGMLLGPELELLGRELDERLLRIEGRLIRLEQAVQDLQPVKCTVGEPVDWGPDNDPSLVTSTVSDGLESTGSC